MKSLSRIFEYVKPFRKYALLNVLFNLLSTLFGLFSLVLIIPFLGILFGQTEPVTQAPTWKWDVDTIRELFNYTLSSIIENRGQLAGLVFICLLVGITSFLKNLFRFLAKYYIVPLRYKVVHATRNRIYNKVVGLPIQFFTDSKKGDLISRISTDVQEMEVSVLSILESLFKDPFAIIVSVIALLMISPKLTLFILVLLPVSGLIIGRLGKTLKANSKLSQHRLGKIISQFEETLGGLRIIKGFNAETYSTSRFNKINEDYYDVITKTQRRKDSASPVSEFLGTLIVIVVLWFGGQMVMGDSSNLAPEAFIGFIAIFSQIISPAKSFSNAYFHIQKGAAAVDRIEEVLQADEQIKEHEQAVSKGSFDSEIEYKNVSFKYVDQSVLSDVSFKVKRGQSVAIVGQSGAGKSTLVDLLPRFYDVTKGEILVDGIDIRKIKLKDLRSLFGIVTQEAILFNDTVYNNIAFGLDSVGEEEVVAAAKIANAHSFIENLEHGYETNIGDRGNKLSGGERQRLTIARAILKNPPILILDEATSSLDSESEKLVQQALIQLMQNRTSLIIAHRLSTIQHADEIIVLDNGEIKERGNHISLINRNGLYKKLVDLQAF